MWPSEPLPPLDCHAHIAPDATAGQVAGLAGAQVFAVTRTLAEAASVARRGDPGLVWGIGVHPGDRAARETFDSAAFARLVGHFALVGEIGLDPRGGDQPGQRRILEQILAIAEGRSVLLSLHSTGAIDEVLEILSRRPSSGAILHWFTGDPTQVGRAVGLGCYFSVNAAMSDEQLTQLPADRVLPETDFPSSRRRTRAGRPGDVASIETRLETIWHGNEMSVRRQLYRNLREIAIASRAIDRLPEPLVDLLLIA